uniref:F-box domain-containing protein n=1 Tax=Panagrellus redivivus TaxID=6233 RepID=A0A7E4VJW6_PANRE
MANSQLKFHLLREVIDEMGGNYCDAAVLGSLLVAGKESAAALCWIVARDVQIHRRFGENKSCQLWIKWGMWQRDIEPVYFQNFALRNTKCLRIDDYRGTNLELVNVASTCARLFVLDCPATHFAALLDTNMDLSNLYEATLHVKDLQQFSSILSYLTYHPGRCPSLDTISISGCWSVENMMECISDYRISSVKTLTLDAKANCCTGFDFSQLSSISKCFPNVEEVSLQVTSNCTHSAAEVDLEAYNQLCESFKAYDPSFHFNFEYGQYNENDEFHKSLENLLASKGKFEMHFTGLDRRCYNVNITYPTQTMTIRIAEVICDHQYEQLYEPMEED